MEQNDKIVLFQEKQIRRVQLGDEWFYNLVDVIEILSESPQPTVYWSKLKKKMVKEEGIDQLFPIWKQLKFEATNGKFYTMDAANTEGVLRVIQSISSPKAEPFKRWLAQVGKQTLDEIENPELGFDRLREIYKAKGYPDEWIERRMQSIETRKQLTDEWKKRDVKEGQEYAFLTAQIAKGTFGLTPTEHKEVKGLKKPTQNLRDHMTPLELIFTALGEEATRQVTLRDNALGFNENYDAAKEGGEAAGEARDRLEKRLGQKVVSDKNYLNQEGKPKEIE
jgi:DNA-damage-inducible protein D